MGRTGEDGGCFPQLLLCKFAVPRQADIHAERNSPLIVIRRDVDGILHDEVIVIVVRVLYHAGTELLQIREASGVLRPRARFVEGGKQQTCQNCDDCNNNEKFYQSKKQTRL